MLFPAAAPGMMAVVIPPTLNPFSHIPRRAVLRGAVLARLGHWTTATAADGRPVIDHTPYNEWVYWDSLGYGPLAWDVVVTNQPVISAEYYGAARCRIGSSPAMTPGTAAITYDPNW